jgi:hypothetical protein
MDRLPLGGTFTKLELVDVELGEEEGVDCLSSDKESKRGTSSCLTNDEGDPELSDGAGIAKLMSQKSVQVMTEVIHKPPLMRL